MFLLRRHFSASLRRGSASQRRISVRSLYDSAATIRCPRDRGLDYAVARERHLKPLINLKDLIISEPSKSAPLSQITQLKEALKIPFRPIEFIRKYPSIFQEFHPGSLSINPHVKLTPEMISLSSDERLLYQSVDYKQGIACRLLKLLMMGKINKIPVFLLEKLKWELGLPQDYEVSIIPEFPDYFRLIDGDNQGVNGKMLELVCWSDELSVSEVEKKGDKDGKIHFSLQYSKDFEMDKKYKKWVDEWQKLPYVSPYGNATPLAAKTDESDKWAVAVLHEVLSLFVGKKAERENMLSLGEFFGLRSRFKRAFLQHPGIFYVSSKNGMHTVVLRDAYKRGMLIERHPLMDMRFKYVQLMNVVVKDDSTSAITQQKAVYTRKGEGDLEDDRNGEKDNSEAYDASDYDHYDGEEEEGENKSEMRKLEVEAPKLEDNNPKRSVASRANGRQRKSNDTDGENGSSRRFSKRRNVRGDQDSRGRALQRLDEGENETARERFIRQTANFEDKYSKRNVARSPSRQSRNENNHENLTRPSKQTDGRSDHIVSRRVGTKLDENKSATDRKMFKRQPVLMNNNFKRNVARSRNGRNTNDSACESTSVSRRTKRRSDERVPRRTMPS